MNLYYIDKDYVQYLKKYESRVEDVNYGNHLKPHLGIILKINNYNYYVPLSSPKKKHLKMRNMPDFLKILDHDNKLLAVLNLNNMIPVPDNLITLLNSYTIDKFRSFNSQEEKNHYIDLLNRELKLINELNESNRITNTARKLYRRKQQYPNDKISKRYCDFKKLEEICYKY